MAKVIGSLEDFIARLKESVNIDCGTVDIEGVSRQADLFAEWFTQAGFHAQVVDLGDKVGHGVFATNAPEADRYDILLSGHLDTVFKKGTAVERPFRVEGSRAFGPGVYDMKDGDLTILWALDTLEPEVLKRLKIAVCLNPDEETGSIYSTEWIDSYARKSTYALVFESTTAPGTYTEQRKGISHIDIFLKGVGAHAGFCPEKGRSAVDALAQCIIRVNALRTENTTVNFGVVDGGTIANAIAERAHARIDVRFWTNEQKEAFFEGFKKEFETPFGRDIEASYEVLVVEPPMVKVAGVEKLKALIDDACAAQGIRTTYIKSGGISDACHISTAGTPVIDSLGPVGDCAHTEREWLDLDSVEPAVERLKHILRHL